MMKMTWKKKSSAWTKKLSVGNSIIDTEHRNLIAMINDIEFLINARDSSALLQAFEQLEHWLCIHFANEANIAQTIDYDFTQHKLAEQNLQEEICRLKDELLDKDGKWSEDEIKRYAVCLKNWLTKHIVDVDMLMKPALQNLPYDFLPKNAVDKCGCGCKVAPVVCKDSYDY